MNSLFTPYKLGNFDLNHRVVLAPMSRYRCSKKMSHNPMTVEYYEQRSTDGGLLIMEATHINPEGTPIWKIYESIREHGGEAPGIWNDDQTAANRLLVEVVHKKGAKISCQLQHCGRVAQEDIKDHPIIKGKNFPIGPVSSSAVRIKANSDKGNHYNWDQPSSIPRALDISDICRVFEDYANAASNAVKASILKKLFG